MGIINGANIKNVTRKDPTQWTIHYAKTDRSRSEVPWVGCEVHHWYYIQVSYMWTIPRPFREDYIEGATGTSWVELIRDESENCDHKMRAKILARPCESSLSRADQEVWWLTLQDGHMTGPGRDKLTGCSHGLCATCKAKHNQDQVERCVLVSVALVASPLRWFRWHWYWRRIQQERSCHDLRPIRTNVSCIREGGLNRRAKVAEVTLFVALPDTRLELV